MSKVSYKILDKKFKNENSKQAYLDACKWIAQNIVSKKEISNNISIKITKIENVKIPTFNVELIVDVDRKKLQEDFCGKCKHIYNTFYQVDKMHCEECKMKAYCKTNDNYTKGLINIYKQIFEGKENEEDS